MSKVVIFGNSGSGKSTLAKQLALHDDLAHLDLDTIAWKPITPPERLPIAESSILLNNFLLTHNNWVVEGCYADLLAVVIEQADEIIFLNLPVSACIKNAKARPWEPHKYESKAAQDANLAMLVNWISQYADRTDTFSKVAHEKLYHDFKGKKRMHLSNEPEV
ncbi:AAA family ATPase [Colwellia sp. 4_MG-2023]|uniref:AAA family ATPase n=1 Tax=unclassified Colwellia TaxID=196834 RepID=UPI0026E1FE4D|nr:MULTISPECIES: AAA family ATPase [unclassified Colwellia]MDO6489072.1 AAA family ATPase [Colwellia sp. 6_MG-2023]MDO6508140.1 AAA family ATPase [Colwellia sp. 5_MG-2023]MDO6556836.1 AAA family ATPase [Colwellia sp. 4_MG-2023]